MMQFLARDARCWMLVLAVVIAPAVAASSPKPAEPATVKDYFLLVPEKYFPYDLPFRQQVLRSEHRGTVLDLRNGYISWDASDAPDSFEFVIFKKSDGRHVVAYNDTGDDFDRDEGPRLILLSYEGGIWRDVTSSLLPVAVDKKLGYKLPRRGKSIEVTDGRGRTRYILTWANDRFHLRRPAGK